MELAGAGNCGTIAFVCPTAGAVGAGAGAPAGYAPAAQARFVRQHPHVTPPDAGGYTIQSQSTVALMHCPSGFPFHSERALGRATFLPVLATLVSLVPASMAACDKTPADLPTAQLQVRTDKSEYSLASDNAATTVLLNLGPAVVYAPMNEYVYVERLVGGRWQDRRPWFAVDGVGISFPVAPGDSLAESMGFRVVGRQPGMYRFVFEVAYDSLGRRLVPEELRTSPPFELRP